jgi:hypothetical protein
MGRVLVMAGILAASGPAAADRTTEAAELFERGRALAKDGSHAEACAAFARSHELVPAIGTQLNLGDCQEHLGQHAQAWRLFDDAASQEQASNPERAKYARGRADGLLPRLATVIVRIVDPAQPGVTVAIGGRLVKTAAEIRDVADPGEVTVEAAAPGKPAWTRTQTAEAGATLTFEVAFETVGAGPAPDGEVRRAPGRVKISLALAGAGAVGLVTSTLLAVKAKSDHEAQIDNGNCTAELVCNDAGFVAATDAVRLANIATGVGVAGLLLVAGAGVVYFTAPKEVVVAPVASPTTVGLAASVRF